MGRNLKNALLAFLAPLPSILFYTFFLKNHPLLSPISSWCYHHPLLLANALFFFNIDLLFWVISLIQSSNWMIDVYWTVIPVLLVHYFQTHPGCSEFNLWRSRAVVAMTWVWAVRLTHNYFRREKWQWGAREDWRFTDLARQYGGNWWWVSFFAVYLIQQVPIINFDVDPLIVKCKPEILNPDLDLKGTPKNSKIHPVGSLKLLISKFNMKRGQFSVIHNNLRFTRFYSTIL